MEYHFDFETILSQRWRRVFFRFPGIIESVKEGSGGWFCGTLATPKQRDQVNKERSKETNEDIDDHYIVYYHSSVHPEERELWKAAGVDTNNGRMVIVIQNNPETQDWLDKTYCDPINDLWIDTISDKRSRDYLLACVKNTGIVEYHVEVDDDEIASRIENDPAWHVRSTQYEIDGFAIYSCKFSGKHDVPTLEAIERLAGILKKRNPIIQCWECGQSSHWLDTRSDRGLNGYINNLEGNYCGC